MGEKFAKRYSPRSFHPISTKFYDTYVNHGGIQAIAFMTMC